MIILCFDPMKSCEYLNKDDCLVRDVYRWMSYYY